MKWVEGDWYALPRYYDIVHAPDTIAEAALLDRIYRRYRGDVPGRLLEPACGSGRLLRELAARGYSGFGFDASAAMLDYGRGRLGRLGDHVRLGHGALERFRAPGRFDMAFCLFSTFKYLRSETDARAHLECVARALRRGGLYVLGLHLADYTERGCRHERHAATRRGTQVVCNVRTWPANRRARSERVRSRLLVDDGRTRRGWETNWHFRTYDTRQLDRLLAGVPSFERITTCGFDGDLDVTPAAMEYRLDNIWVLRRR